jgi:succinylglutamate desuccinylase
MHRKLGEITGKEKGPLLILIGQIHGNEIAGTEAILRLFSRIDDEFEKNPSFYIKGKIVGLIGNLHAAEEKVRYVHQDLNRIWTLPYLNIVKKSPQDVLNSEEKEFLSLFRAIEEEVYKYPSEFLFLLDLHTTTATGGIFIIPTEGEASLKVAESLYAPQIDGLMQDLGGTLVSFVQEQPWPVPSDALVFESGQHDDPESIDNALSAVINCLRSLKMVPEESVELNHDERLKKWSDRLPQKTKMVYRHSLHPEDQFRMEAGYENFMPVHKGQLLAKDRKGDIRSPMDGYILMPLYKNKGHDGFFIIEEIENKLD